MTDSSNSPITGAAPIWPALPLDAWRDSYATLHMMTQVVGKVRLERAPMVNHWWQVPLYLTARGLSTSAIPHGARSFQIDFDFIDHELRIEVDDGGHRSIALRSRPLSEFYRDTMDALADLGVPVTIWPRPVEVEDIIPFDRDRGHATYDPEPVHRCWQVLAQADRVMTVFRSGFVGKCSPVHFFWGSFDLAVTRFSGRRAPEHPGGVPNLADRVTREAYSRECSSCGFWPGSGAVQEPAFYSYAYPEPEGYRDHPILPGQARYDDEMREFILPYEAVRQASDPDRMLLDFFQSTYEAAAVAGEWNRGELEQDYPAPGRPVPPEPAPTFPVPEEADTPSERSPVR
ncbi:MAG TPA: DUF5996 family protein [Longimicrobiaceae bacterium]|nr:DUF5996 family protein [Longimicrobiaceae bacterium]